MARYRVTTTVPHYNGERAGVKFGDGAAEFDSEAQPSALAYFQRHGYGLRLADAADDGAAEFDPSGHTVDEVNAYLADAADDTERARVLAAETAGQARKGIVEGPHAQPQS